MGTILMKKMKKIWKEICDFYCFFWLTPRQEKNIVFYAEHKGYYPYLEGLINQLIDRHKVTICYITSDYIDSIVRKDNLQIRVFYFDKLLPYFMLFVNSKIFIMTLTDLNQFYLRRSINKVHYVYIFHSLISTHMQYREGAFDHYDTILCSGLHHEREIRSREEQEGLSRKELVRAGYYRLERVYEAHKKVLAKGSTSGSKKTILIAPSWGKENILEICGELIVRDILEAGFKVIVRPHPEIARRSPHLLSVLTEKFGNEEDFFLETSIVSDDSLLNADVLITDWSGIGFEYAFGTERPVLFLDVPRKINNQNFEKLDIEPLEVSFRSQVGIIVSSENLHEVRGVIRRLLSNRENYVSRIKKLRSRVIYSFGHSSEVGAQSIIDRVKL